MFLGVDGHSKGWVAVALDDKGFVGAQSFESFASLMAGNAGAKVIAVDIPIGLVDVPVREADQAARAVLVGKSSSVFNAYSKSTPRCRSASCSIPCRCSARSRGEACTPGSHVSPPRASCCRRASAMPTRSASTTW